MTVGRLKAEMSVAEIRDWAAFYRTRPFASEALDWQIAVLTMVVSNMFLAKDAKRYTVDDFRQLTRNRIQTESPKQSEADKFRTRRRG